MHKGSLYFYFAEKAKSSLKVDSCNLDDDSAISPKADTGESNTTCGEREQNGL